MDIFGVGPLEFVFIILIALIVLGPSDMVKAGRTVGKLLRKVVTSSEWRTIQQASKEFRTLPNRLIREAGIEELKEEIRHEFSGENRISNQLSIDDIKKDFDQWKQDISTWTTPPKLIDDEQVNIIESDQIFDSERKIDPEESEP